MRWSDLKHLSYTHIQLLAWSSVFALFCLSIYLRPFVVQMEYVYALILITTAGLFSDFIRRIYKHRLSSLSVAQQAMYLTLLSVGFAALATLVLVSTVFIVSTTPLAFPIPADQRWFVIKKVFFPNWMNVNGLMLLWSSLYFAITRSRMLTATKTALEQTQLEVLQNQLNPHFLFNALNNIRALVLEDADKSREMITSLSDILRYSLSQKSAVKVALREEMAFINNYIDLCKIQFEDRLHFYRDIKDECQDCLVPKMVLQLCIENAIKHGIEPNVAGGQITLFAKKKGDMLQLTIENTMSNDDIVSASLGIGLHNLKARFQLLYQASATFETHKGEDKFTVEIRLPVETNAVRLSDAF